MSYRLVIAEKPSVGAAYAKVLGATNRQDGYWEGNGYLVSWCIGHLVELAPPNVYDEKYVKWSVADLPILPERWLYLVSASTKKQFGIERGEMEPEEFMTEIKEMISSLVNTTEAVKGANALMKNKVIGACPNCGTNVVEREKGWFCENRECRFALWKDSAYFKRLGKHLDGRVVDKLLRDGRVRLKDCKSAKGKTYNATVLLSAESDGRSKFSLEFENGGC